MEGTRDIEALIELMARLPGLGPRSARRAVLALLKKRGQLMAPLAQAMATVALNARDCTVCGNIGTADICPICADPRRDASTVLVVEQPKDLLVMEKTGLFRGVYHVLLGRLDPLAGVGPDAITLDALLARIGPLRP